MVMKVIHLMHVTTYQMRPGKLIIFLLFALSVRLAGQFTYPQYNHYTLADGLPQMQVMSMFQDSRGYIWIGTKGGACFFNGEKFITLTARDGMINEYINCFGEDSAGRVWMGTRDGLACYDGTKITSYPNNGYCSALVIDDSGKIWFYRSTLYDSCEVGYFYMGEYTYLPKFKKVDEFYGDPSIRYSPVNNAVILSGLHTIYEIKENRIAPLFNTADSIISILDPEYPLMFAILHDRLNIKFIKYDSGKFSEVANIRNGQISGQNLLKASVNFTIPSFGSPVYTLSSDTLIANNCADLQINRFLFDIDNNLWIGSEEGLYKLFRNEFETFKSEYLSGVWDIGEDRYGKMLFGSYHFGLKVFDGKKFRSISGFMGYRNVFHFRTSTDKDGAVFFPTGGGLSEWNGNSLEIIDSNPCITTFYDKKRELLLTGWEKRVNVYNSCHKLTKIIGKADGLECKTYIITINKDRKDNYWFGSFTGLSRYNPETGEIVNYNRRNGRLPADGVITIHTDYSGRTWFGSTNGLLWYDEKADSVRCLTMKEIEGDMSIVISVDSTWLVFSQQEGIYLMDLQKYYKSGITSLTLYNDKNGFRGIEPGQDGSFTDSKGNIWMTTSTEVVKFNPKNLLPAVNSMNIIFTGCNGDPLPFRENHITLDKNVKTAILTFDAICFNRPHSVLYSWKIEGSENDWSSWKTDNYIVLSNLSDGEKTISLRAKIPGLPVEDFSYAKLGLDVRIAIWKQDWFFPFLFVLFSALTVISVTLFVRARMRMVNALRQAKMFQVQAIQTQMNPHFIFNALAALQSMILSFRMETANDYLIKLADMVRGFLDASASTGSMLEKNPEKGELPLERELEILRNYTSFQQIIHPGRFDVQIIVDDKVNTEEQTIPPMIIQPFVENSIRHGLLLKKGRGVLEIKIKRDEYDNLIVVIADDGIGIEKAKDIISRSPFRYVSRGTELTMNRIRLLNELGYHIEVITDSSENGTTITIKLNHNENRH